MSCLDQSDSLIYTTNILVQYNNIFNSLSQQQFSFWPSEIGYFTTKVSDKHLTWWPEFSIWQYLPYKHKLRPKYSIPEIRGFWYHKCKLKCEWCMYEHHYEIQKNVFQEQSYFIWNGNSYRIAIELYCYRGLSTPKLRGFVSMARDSTRVILRCSWQMKALWYILPYLSWLELRGQGSQHVKVDNGV